MTFTIDKKPVSIPLWKVRVIQRRYRTTPTDILATQIELDKTLIRRVAQRCNLTKGVEGLKSRGTYCSNGSKRTTKDTSFTGEPILRDGTILVYEIEINRTKYYQFLIGGKFRYTSTDLNGTLQKIKNNKI